MRRGNPVLFEDADGERIVVDFTGVGLGGGDDVEDDAGDADHGDDGGADEDAEAEGNEGEDPGDDVDDPDGEAEVEGSCGGVGDEGVAGLVLVDEPEDEGANEVHEGGGEEEAREGGEVG